MVIELLGGRPLWTNPGLLKWKKDMAKAYACLDFALLLVFIVVTNALACQPRRAKPVRVVVAEKQRSLAEIPIATPSMEIDAFHWLSQQVNP
jgi:hypothetical protein